MISGNQGKQAVAKSQPKKRNQAGRTHQQKQNSRKESLYRRTDGAPREGGQPDKVMTPQAPRTKPAGPGAGAAAAGNPGFPGRTHQHLDQAPSSSLRNPSPREERRRARGAGGAMNHEDALDRLLPSPPPSAPPQQTNSTIQSRTGNRCCDRPFFNSASGSSALVPSSLPPRLPRRWQPRVAGR
jgi:hypothetical protein